MYQQHWKGPVAPAIDFLFRIVGLHAFYSHKFCNLLTPLTVTKKICIIAPSYTVCSMRQHLTLHRVRLQF